MSILIAKGRSFSSHRTDAEPRAPSQRLVLVSASMLVLAVAILAIATPSADAQDSKDITVQVITPWNAAVVGQDVIFTFPGPDASFAGTTADRKCTTSALGKCTLVLSAMCNPGASNCFTAADLGVDPTATGTAGMKYYANASRLGNVTVSGGLTAYKTSEANAVTLVLSPTVGISGKTEILRTIASVTTYTALPDSTPTDRLSADLIDSSGVLVLHAVDGGTNDVDGLVNGYIWMNLMPSVYTDTYDLRIGRSGFIDGYAKDHGGSFVVSEAIGAYRVIPLQFLTRVDLVNEISVPILETAQFVRLGGKLNHEKEGNSYYFTTSGGALQVAVAGYVSLDTTKDTGLANLPITPNARTHVVLNGASPCLSPVSNCVDASGVIVGSKLLYTVKVIVKDELGSKLVPATGSVAVKIGSVTADPGSGEEAGNTYYAKASSPDALVVTASGYVSLNTAAENTGFANVIPSVSKQTVITLTGPEAGAFKGTFQPGPLTGSGLKFTLKATIHNELGDPVIGLQPNQVVAGSCQAKVVVTNVAYLACAAGAATMKVSAASMVERTVTFTSTSAMSQTVQLLTGTTTGILYPLKVSVGDELGNVIADGASTVSYGTDNQPRVKGEWHYFQAASAGDLQVVRSDMIPSRPVSEPLAAGITTVTTAQKSVILSGSTTGSTDQSSPVQLAGLKYRLRVDVNDAFGRGLDAASVAFGNAPIVQSGSSYYARAAYSTTPTPLAVTLPGYLRLDTAAKNAGFASVSLQENSQTQIRLTGTSGCASWNSCNAINTQFTKIGSGLEHAVRVQMLRNELGLPIPQTQGFVSCPGAAWVEELKETYCAPTSTAQIVAQPTGYVSAATTVVPTDHTVKSICFGCPDGDAPALKFQLKVTVKDEFGTLRHGDPTSVTYGGTSASASDAASYYFAPSSMSARTISVTRPNFVDTSLQQVTTIQASQTQVIFSGKLPYASLPNIGGETITTQGLRYPLKVVVNDQFGNNVTSSALNYAGIPSVTFDGQAPTIDPAKTNEFYFPIAAAAKPLLVTSPGFQWTQDGGFGAITTSTSAQKTIVLSGTTECVSTCPSGSAPVGRGLSYPLKVIVKNELGAAIPAATVMHDGVPAATSSGGAAYVPSLGTGGLAVSAPGWVNLDTSIDTALADFPAPASGTLEITLSGQTPLTTPITSTATQVTATGLRYPFNITGVRDEAGASVEATVTCGNSPALTANTGVYCEAAVPITIKANASARGYLPASIELEPDTTRQQLVRFGEGAADVNAPPLSFPLRVFVRDELGLASIVNANVTWAGRSPNATRDNARYFLGTGVGNLAVSAPKFVDLNTTWENTALSNVPAGVLESTTVILSGNSPARGQLVAGDVVTGSGLKYRLKVILEDELGQAVTGAAVTYANESAAFTLGNTSYFATNLTSARLNASAPGYVDLSVHENPGLAHLSTAKWNQTTVRLTNATPAAATAPGGVLNATGLRHAIRIDNVTDDAGSPLLPGVNSNITCGGVPATLSGGKAYCRAIVQVMVNASALGHVNASALVTPSLTAAKVIQFSGLDGISALNRSIRVTVVRAPDNATISNATVKLAIATEANPAEVKTDASGRAFFARTGLTTINVQATGYKDGRCTVTGTNIATASCVIQLESLTPLAVDTTPKVRIEPFPVAVSRASNMTLVLTRAAAAGGAQAVVYVSYSGDGIGFQAPVALRTTNDTTIDHAFAQDGAYQFWAFIAGEEPTDVGRSPPQAKIVIDRAPPAIDVQGGHDLQQTPNLRLAFTTADGHLAEVVTRIDGALILPMLDGNHYRLDIAELAPGAHVLNITAKDAAGNSATRLWAFNITPAKLGLKVSAIPEVLNVKTTISAEATGSIGARIEILVDNVLVKTGLLGKATVEFNPAQLSEGLHEVTILIQDDHGQTETRNATFLVDRTLPTVHFDASSSNASRVRGNATDNDAIATIRLLVNGNVVAKTSNPVFDFILTSAVAHNATIEATDRAGNVGRFNLSIPEDPASPDDVPIERTTITDDKTSETNESENTSDRPVPSAGAAALILTLVAATFMQATQKRRRL